MKKVLVLAGINWNDPLQRHQQFTNYLSRLGYEVVFVEHIISTKLTLRRLWEKIHNRKRGEKEGNAVPKNVKIINMSFINPGSCIFAVVNWLKAKRMIKYTGKEFELVINYIPANTTRYIYNRVHARKYIYDCVRNFESWEGCYKNVTLEEKLLFETCNAVFTDSYYLTKKCMEKSTSVYQFLPIANEEWEKGCNMAKRKGNNKICDIAYFGSIGSHLDMDVFLHLSRQGYKIHIWGDTELDVPFALCNHGYISDLARLAKEIIETTDAIVLPYLKTMDGVIPAKMMQCLRTYLPVFIGEFYDAEALAEYVYVYKDSEELSEMILCYNENEHNERVKKIKEFLRDKNEESQYMFFGETINKI